MILARHLISCLSLVCRSGIAISLFFFAHHLSVFTYYRGLRQTRLCTLQTAVLQPCSQVLPIENDGKPGWGSASAGSAVRG